MRDFTCSGGPGVYDPARAHQIQAFIPGAEEHFVLPGDVTKATAINIAVAVLILRGGTATDVQAYREIADRTERVAWHSGTHAPVNWRRQCDMARALGLSERQFRRIEERLVRFGLIARTTAENGYRGYRASRGSAEGVRFGLSLEPTIANYQAFTFLVAQAEEEEAQRRQVVGYVRTGKQRVRLLIRGIADAETRAWAEEAYEGLRAFSARTRLRALDAEALDLLHAQVIALEDRIREALTPLAPEEQTGPQTGPQTDIQAEDRTEDHSEAQAGPRPELQSEPQPEPRAQAPCPPEPAPELESDPTPEAEGAASPDHVLAPEGVSPASKSADLCSSRQDAERDVRQDVAAIAPENTHGNTHASTDTDQPVTSVDNRHYGTNMSGAAVSHVRPHIQPQSKPFESCNDLQSKMMTPAYAGDRVSLALHPDGRNDCFRNNDRKASLWINPEILQKLNQNTLKDLASEDAAMYLEVLEDWRDCLPYLLRDLSINISAWLEATDVMGDEIAFIALLVIDRNRFHPVTPVINPGGTLRACTRRAITGELNLTRAILGIWERDRQGKQPKAHPEGRALQ
ncbi:replication initiation protein RepC [Ruegeria sp.]|uniref:replication initiation protein RepC n=1 Tax=Ruegeria sp. TaxID=1879320 RepID=UPI003B004D2D